MKVQYINPFIEAAHEVFHQLVHYPLKLGQPVLKTSPITSRDVTVIIGVIGKKLRGQVLYSMDTKVAIAVASAMQRKNIAELDEMAKSAVGEMSNILTGNAATHLAEVGYPCLITPPTIIEGKNVRVSTMDMHTISVPLYSALGDMTIDVAIKEY